MNESKVLSYWESNARFLHFYIEKDKEYSDQLYDFFKTAFTLRDKRFGSPDYKRCDDRIFKTTIWELAETFFAHFTSNEFVSKLRQYSIDPNGPMESKVQNRIAILDDYYLYGFVSTSKKANKDHHRFWQLYVEGLTSAEIEKIIPSKYFSKTRHNDIIQPEGTSPLLIGKRRDEAIRQLRGETSTNVSENAKTEIALRLMSRSNKEATYLDLLQAKFYRRWNHPIVIFDNNPDFENDAHFFPTINNLDFLLDRLSLMYPRLSGHPYSLSGKPKDFNQEFLYFG